MSDRDGSLRVLLETVQDKIRRRAKDPTHQEAENLCKDLKELLWQLRDEHFEKRLMPPLKERPRLSRGSGSTLGSEPESNCKDFKDGDLLEGLTWDKIHRAVLHDLGDKMGEKEKEKGIFVVDKYDNIYCYTKLRGTIQHSSFVRGHSVKFAGGFTVSEGKLKEISPHSGHYRPEKTSLDKLRNDWASKGVDFSEVIVKPFEKEKFQVETDDKQSSSCR